MHETLRMLGAEHEADLARDAAKWQRARRLLSDPQDGTEAQQQTRTRQNAKRALLSVLVPRFRS